MAQHFTAGHISPSLLRSVVSRRVQRLECSEWLLVPTPILHDVRRTCGTSGVAKTYSGCQRHVVVSAIKTPVFRLRGLGIPGIPYPLFLIKCAHLFLPDLMYGKHITLALGYQHTTWNNNEQSFLSIFANSMLWLQPIHTGKGVSWLLTYRVHSLDFRWASRLDP